MSNTTEINTMLKRSGFSISGFSGMVFLLLGNSEAEVVKNIVLTFLHEIFKYKRRQNITCNDILCHVMLKQGEE